MRTISDSPSNHPGPDQLRAFCQGFLPPEAAQAIERHIEDCQPCVDTLLSLSEHDTLIELLRAARQQPDALTVGVEVSDGSQSLVGEPPEIPGGLQNHPRYKILQRIGQGGMGDVFLAEHRLMSRQVALKIINPSLVAKPKVVERFEREVKAAARLSHPNIVTAYDADQAGSAHFLVMEYVPGVDLATLVKQSGPLPAQRACNYIYQAALGLQHASEQGMVHRDIKPHNLMVVSTDSDEAQPKDLVKILDFGLASLTVAEANDPAAGPVSGSLTSAGAVMGTPDYMPPEQATDARSVDIRSDIYALGATLHFLLTGRPPRKGSPTETQGEIAVVHDPRDPLRSNEAIPPALVAVVEKMMARRPEDRFQRPAEIAEALLPLTRPLAVNPTQPGSVGRPGLWIPVAAIATIAVALLWGDRFGGGHHEQDRSDPQRPPESTFAMTDVSPGSESDKQDIVDPRGDGADDNTNIDAAQDEMFPPVAFGATLQPGDAFYAAALSKIHFVGNDGPGLSSEQWKGFTSRRRDAQWVWTYARLDGPGDAFLSPDSRDASSQDHVWLVARTPHKGEVRGTLYCLHPTEDDVIQLPFVIAAEEWSDEHHEYYLRIASEHYAFLRDSGVSGTAWFRHRAAALEKQMPTASASRSQPVETDRRSQTSDPTFDFFSGGQAIADNLQLNRLLRANAKKAADVPIASIRGVQVREFDFKKLIEGRHPEADPLARLIPHDQHAFFFTSFAGLQHTLDYARTQVLPILTLAQAEGERTDLVEQYQTQLGVRFDQLTRQLAPQFIKSLVITGGDTYFDSGSDLAVLFEAVEGESLHRLLAAQLALSAKEHPNAEGVSGHIDTVAYTGHRSQDRALCSYLARVGEAVVLSNSLQQLERLVKTSKDTAASLSATDEYRFFRDRYPINSDETSGLLIISDATIRRWCGPRWRIGASRRIWAAAAMSEARAIQVDASLRGAEIDATAVEALELTAGELDVNRRGIYSRTFNNLRFMTPINELEMEKVTASEKAAYERWQSAFERSWNTAFDPIAIFFQPQKDQWSADLTVMPLANRSQYRTWIELSGSAELSPLAADAHPESLVHATMAIDKEAPLLQFVKTSLQSQLPESLQIDPLEWFGSTVSVYADLSPHWSDLSDANRWEGMDRTPIALSFEVADSSHLVPFLVALRGVIQQSAPGLTEWHTHQHGGHEYTQIVAQSRPPGSDTSQDTNSVYYGITDRNLIFTGDEVLLHRAFDRADSRPSEDDSVPEIVVEASTSEGRWLGKHFAVQLDGEFFALLDRFAMGRESELSRIRWQNIPILNEWKRLFPEADPREIHKQLWARDLHCVGRGRYVWDEELQSMTSTAFVPPGQTAAEGEAVTLPWADVESAAFGITFEHRGLRAITNVHYDR